eukprot:TRINITY_DN13661_c0_g5_i1.p3 TRINITY_DN13661_c0_g5~~TRINITY_DN13661_c0_g5_i1.p3  ORF type:complete len:103 (-),score=1.78 TRINITY_DN13661_c0_g5_i1:644-952(-)
MMQIGPQISDGVLITGYSGNCLVIRLIGLLITINCFDQSIVVLINQLGNKICMYRHHLDEIQLNFMYVLSLLCGVRSCGLPGCWLSQELMILLLSNRIYQLL